MASDILAPILKKLANINGRRPEREQLTEEVLPEENLLDFSGISGLKQPSNDYIEDPINGGSIPERYDTRANSVMIPVDNQPQDSGVLGAIGSSLGAANLIDQEFEIPKRESQESDSGFLRSLGKRLGQSFIPTEEELPGVSFWKSVGSGLSDLGRGVKEGFYQGIPSQSAQSSVMPSQNQEFRNRLIDEAEPSPANVVFGSTDKIANSPELRMQFNEITGMDLSDEMINATKAYENLLSDIENPLLETSELYDTQMQEARARILANEPTEMDKFYVGMALLMPVLLGGAFGKDVGLAALGGGLQGISSGIDTRQKAIANESERLADLTSKKANVQSKIGELKLEKMKIPQMVKKNFPDEKEHLKGMKGVKFIDPESGEQKSGVELKPDLVIQNQYITNKHSLESAQKKADEIAEIRGVTDEYATAAHEFAELMSKVKDKNLAARMIEAGVLRNFNMLGANRVERVQHKGKTVNPYLELVSISKKIEDHYRRQNKIRASLVGSDVEDKIIPNMFKNAFTPEDSIDVVLNLGDLMNTHLLTAAHSQGFYRAPLENAVGKQRKKLYDMVNKAFEQKESGSALKERRYKGAK